MVKKYPAYSVLMSVYCKDKPEWLTQSIDSILAQTIQPAEFVIIKDGPVTQELNDILNNYEKEKPKLFNIIQLDNNLGLGPALKIGVENCHNEYIARIDADDYAVPTRIEKQLAIFKRHPELGLVGSNVEEFSDTIDNIISHVVLPENHEEIYAFSKKRCPFRHPSLLYKKTAVLKAGNYRAYHLCEDYDLYTRLLQTGCKCFNIQEPLTYMRVDKDFYKRRGGIKYLKSILKFKREQAKTGFFSKKDYIISAAPHIIVCLMPNKLRDWTYRNLLRTKTNRNASASSNVKSYIKSKAFRKLLLYIAIVFPLLCENILSTSLGDTNSKFLSVLACIAILIISIKYYITHRAIRIDAFFVIMLLLILLHSIITFFVAPKGLAIATNNNMITPYGLIGYFMLFVLIDICSKDKNDLILLFKAMTIVMTIAVFANILITGDLHIANNVATFSEAIKTRYTNSRKWLFGHRNLIFIHHLMWLLVTFIYYKLRNKNYKKMFLIQMGITIAVSLLSWNSTMMLTSFVIFILYIVKFNIFKKVNILHFLAIYLIAEIGIVFLRLQSFFSFIIKDILHRSLTFTGRTTVWDYYIKQFSDGGIMQKLFGNSGITELRANTHNMFLGLLSFTGVIGTLLYFGLVLLSVRQLWRNRKEDSARFISIIIFGFLINALTMEFYLQPLFAFFIGYKVQQFSYPPTNKAKVLKSEKIKILYMINFLNDGGPSRVLENIIKGLDRKKYDIYILTLVNQNSAHAIETFSKYNLKIIALDYDKKLLSVLKKKRAITETIRSISPDIIHVHGIVSTLLISISNIKCTKISTIHNNMFEDYRFTYGDKKGALYSMIHLIANKRFNKIICCSRSSYDAIKNFNKNTTFILNGIDPSVPISNRSKIRASIRNELKIKQDAFVYMYCGVINQRKRVVELIKLFNSTLTKDEYLIIVGNGALIQEAKKAASNDKIIFTGFKENTIDYMLAADAYVSNSASEGLSISIIEALSCGMPLLLSDIPSHKECFEIDKQAYIGETFNQKNFIQSKSNLRRHKINPGEIIAFQNRYLSSDVMSHKYSQYYK